MDGGGRIGVFRRGLSDIFFRKIRQGVQDFLPTA